MTAGSYTQRDVVVSVELPDGRIVHPVAFDTDDFLQARMRSDVYHYPDGSAHSAQAMWWPTTLPQPGITWSLHHMDTALRNGPAVVDDFGDLVLVGWRL